MSAVTRLGLFGVFAPAISTEQSEALAGKNISTPGVVAQLIHEFDTWQPEYGGARVYIYKAGGTELASVYTDIHLTEPADNPQILLSQTVNGRTYGKFDEPLYTPHSYYLDINAIDQTGINRPPLTTLDGADADTALVKAEGASVARPLEEHFSQTVWAADYGALGDSPTENAATLTAAMGAAGARAGTAVMIPYGTWPFTQLQVPPGVTLHGMGAGATTLRSTIAGNAITFAGDGCGLRELTIDGLNVVASSVGLYSKGNDDVRLDRVIVRRFETGVRLRGGQRGMFTDVAVANCATGVHLAGHLDTSGGDELRDFVWQGGEIEGCTTNALWLEYIDRAVAHNRFADLVVHDNLGDAVLLTGAQFTRFDQCAWDTNPVGIKVEDDSPLGDENFVRNLHVRGGRFDDSDVRLNGVVQDIQFEDCRFAGSTLRAETTTENQILLIDCEEDATTTLAGDATRFMRWRSNDRGEVRGTTTDGSATKAMALSLGPGETVAVHVTAVANQVDGEGYGVWRWTHAARRDTADLSFDGGTIAFNLGETVAGATSGASGYITAKTGTTATGTLSLRSVSGTFTDNEALQVNGVTRAYVNGAIGSPSVSLVGSLASHFLQTSGMTGSDNLIAAVGGEVQVQVQGVTGRTFEWTVFAEFLRG